MKLERRENGVIQSWSVRIVEEGWIDRKTQKDRWIDRRKKSEWREERMSEVCVCYSQSKSAVKPPNRK